MRSVVRVVTLLLVLAAALPVPAFAQLEDEEEEVDGLRERLTEREDKRRPPKPYRVQIGGRPLVIGGEYEAGLAGIRRYVLGKSAREPDRVLFEQQLELESFYSFGPELSLFGQVDLVMEEDLLAHSVDEVSDQYVELGEIWLNSANLLGSNFAFEIGRLDFEDDRRTWWDDELDALRVIYEKESFEIQLALARELVPKRSDQSYVEPEDDRVLRWIGEVSWDFSADHALELFFLSANDHSERHELDETVSSEREDDSDARLTWLGARALGAFDVGAGHYLGYWAEAASVRGHERLFDYDDVSSSRSQVEEITSQDVGGWGVELGMNWMLPGELEPRLFAGYAFTSGDHSPENGSDRSFRQTELNENEAGFGGVEHYPHFGFLLQPELSNLRVLTLGAGVSILEGSSLDLVYHYDRLVTPADELRDSLLDVELNGRDRDLGQEIDLVLDLEEWTRLELHFIASALRAGRAFGDDHGKWSYGGAAVVKLAF